jgi:hypothetical protein
MRAILWWAQLDADDMRAMMIHHRIQKKRASRG